MNLWHKRTLESVNEFNESYKDFLYNSKTERLCIKEAIKIAKANGYQDLDVLIDNNTKLNPGDLVYKVNKHKNIILFNIGKTNIEEGINMVGAHVDSPRLDIKQNPLYEIDDQVLLKTHYYGGVKKYQWLTRPLSIVGVICKTDGSTIDIKIGEDDNDPVVGISDLLPHLAKDQMQKSASEFVDGESLNILVGSKPLIDSDKKQFKSYILKVLKDKYNILEKDFISSELSLVPSDKVRDYGLDSSMILGYGHDDRVCAYTALMALIDSKIVDKTTCCILVDKEEVGSNGATGMHSNFFINTLSEIINLTTNFNQLILNRTLSNSNVLSSDVCAAYDPNFPGVYEKNNSAYMGKGICILKYSGVRGKAGCNDANAEMIAKVRRIFQENDIVYQTSE